MKRKNLCMEIKRKKIQKLATEIKNGLITNNHDFEMTSEEKERYKQLSYLLFLKYEEERKEISRELHDEIAQLLTGITYELAILSKEASNGTQDLKDKIIKTQSLIEESVETVHRFARDLRPIILDEYGLIAALKSHIKDYIKKYNINVKLSSSSSLSSLNEMTKTVLFRVAQEALTNVAKHSKATKTTIKFRKTSKSIFMDIQDNGKFHSKNKKTNTTKLNRLGILGMQERVNLSGGKFKLSIDENSGTRVSVEIPLSKNKENK